MNSLFEKTNIWENYDSGGIIEKKIPLLEAFLPLDIKSILDAGCGNGIITNYFNKKYDVTGLDTSEKALEFVDGKTLLNSIDDIKSADNSFDLVLTSEVLEHLPKCILSKAVNELKRVSKKYLLITVPHNEMLAQTNIKCPNCGSVFHSYGHLNSFVVEDIDKLVGEGYRRIKYQLGGPQKKQYSKALLKIRQSIGNRYFHPPQGISYCENCNLDYFPTLPGNLISKTTNFLNRFISSEKDYWMFTLYEKD